MRPSEIYQNIESITAYLRKLNVSGHFYSINSDVSYCQWVMAWNGTAGECYYFERGVKMGLVTSDNFKYLANRLINGALELSAIK